MLKGFKQFIMRGNVIDLAVAVVIGAAFGAVITSFVTNVLNPLIAAIVGKPDFSAFNATINGGLISYGLFLNSLISFLLIAGAVYYLIVLPMNALKARQARGQAPADPTSKKCPECLAKFPSRPKGAPSALQPWGQHQRLILVKSILGSSAVIWERTNLNHGGSGVNDPNPLLCLLRSSAFQRFCLHQLALFHHI